MFCSTNYFDIIVIFLIKNILYNKLLTSKYIFLNKLKILIYKLTILSKQFVAQNINYKGVRYKQIHGERKNEILIWREH